MQNTLADNTWTDRQKLALTCRILFENGHDSGLAWQITARVPTIVSVCDLTTAKAVRRARYAEANGADAVMVLPTSYWKLSEAEILAHYAAIGDSIGVPIMLPRERLQIFD